MPVLKSNLTRLSPTKLNGGTVKLQKEIILGSRMSGGSNPFEEDLSNELNPFAEDLEQKNPFDEEEEEGEQAESPNGILVSGNELTPKKSDEKQESLTSTLRRMLVKERKKVKSPTEEKGREKKSLFKLWSPTEQDPAQKSPEKRKGPWLEEEPTSPAGRPEKEALANPECRKRLSFLNRSKGKGEAVPEKSGAEAEKAAEETVKANEPLSVLEILQLIQKRELAVADRQIIELEEECERVRRQTPEGDPGASKDSGRKAKDVALLYEALESELSRIVSQSLTDPQGAPHLGQMVRTIEQEEKADKAREGGSQGRRPRELRRKWREAVKASVRERLSRSQETENAPIAQRLRSLKEQTVTDLISIRKNVIPGYPKEYEAFNVYVRSYHEGVSSCLSEMVQRDLDIQELYIFLEWCHCLYFREVLGHAELIAHISKQHLGPLLPGDTVRRLEDSCVSMVKAQITKHMEKELCAEQKKWRQGTKTFQSELANRVIQILKEHIEKSTAITEDLGVRIVQCSLHSLADFLQSFQTSVQELYGQFAENAACMEYVVPQTIAVVNCCPAFRDYVERLIQKFSPEDKEWKRKIMGALDKVERGGIRLLQEKLFSELKPNFAKLLKKRWLQNPESFEGIVTTVREHFNQFHKMKTPPYQTLVNDVHLRVVTEYLRALVQRRFTCTSSEVRAKLALRLSEESGRLQELFHGLDSTMSWLDPAIDHLAEVIKLKEISSIQMEVGVLVSSYPDVRRGHISAVLDMRGDLSHSNQQLILESLQELDSQDGGTALPRDRALFSEIDEAADVRCVGLGGSSAPGCLIRWLYAIRGR
ncbi:exocyst complex component 3 [Pristis pectinata]|uniref:exocyst complex component 3 n=1 Tax=Pristis pectinata TaxID=685728 RepID=UPI00223DE884|nr:exocyst complex component 3 [Pristis pectinata]XP_051900196.1 exocyst complex component 3 [Pristis pectinata]XP_051900197.1 exocyst complex component 3 [Pristis pectinata]XP_051900198.1 exocyst complex component 3 [Pristis pectinata]XP_051900199.1 exocyst complex component 3 [Pristis pectinata]